MKILITGGAGFIASHIADRYISLNHQVVIVDNLVTGQKKYLNPKAKFYEADIENKDHILEIFAIEKPDVLNHHAAQMDVRKSVADPGFDARVNIIGLINLMEAGKNNGLKKVIFASSGGAIYGDADIVPTPETYPANPVSPYGVSKLTSEHYLYYYSKLYGIKYISLRYGNVYGPRQNPHGEAGVVAIFTKKLLNKTQPVINGDGQQVRDFVYVGDIVAANVQALDKDKSVAVNIGTGKGTNINKIFDELVKLTGTGFNQIHGDPKPGEQIMSVLDPSKALKELNWFSKISITQGLSQTVSFFKNEI